MAKLRVYPQGFSLYVPSGCRDRVAPERGTVQGWSVSATRRLVRWLYSVNFSEVEGRLWAFTLTVRDCPASASDWAKLRHRFLKRLERTGIKSVFWLTEWQRRGVPHLHGVAIQPPGVDVSIQPCWIRACQAFFGDPESVSCWSQMVEPVRNKQGWCEYLSKHSARGVRHYQRSDANIPKGWKGKTGRMWGHRGDWPAHDPQELDIDPKTFFRWRRLTRNLQIASSRSRSDWKAVSYARRMLKSSDRKVSSVRGLSRFMPAREASVFLSFLAGSGAMIHEA